MTEAKSHQTIEVLSRERWSVVSVVESNEYLVTVTPREKLLVANEYIQLRKTVAHMLVDASRLLPDNFALYVIEGVRSVEEQQKRWDRDYGKIQAEFPDKDEAFWQQETRLLVARPAPLANHNCGGAVDVQLFDREKDRFVDMGTPAQSGFGYKTTKMLSEEITEAQKQNRTLLRRAMEQGSILFGIRANGGITVMVTECGRFIPGEKSVSTDQFKIFKNREFLRRVTSFLC